MLMKWQIQCLIKHCLLLKCRLDRQWRIQELGISKHGGAVWAVEFLGSEVCFDAPFIHTLCLVVRAENRIHIVNIVWLLQLKYMRVIQSKFTNRNPPKISNRGARAGAPLLDPPLLEKVYVWSATKFFGK